MGAFKKVNIYGKKMLELEFFKKEISSNTPKIKVKLKKSRVIKRNFFTNFLIM